MITTSGVDCWITSKKYSYRAHSASSQTKSTPRSMVRRDSRLASFGSTIAMRCMMSQPQNRVHRPPPAVVADGDGGRELRTSLPRQFGHLAVQAVGAHQRVRRHLGQVGRRAHDRLAAVYTGRGRAATVRAPGAATVRP